ncbi:endonuclease/exonuclease/phosphatase family protein [Verrucomicrobium spinosum]|uniref:endonuclease/exonuclease/phosphatase family protein n=1 Tax=Verrucomicrobium spinosum TaxID=2736 RepID=UPI0001744ED8|nr:endonuclease/exonuclease/phosphatase family protein [Verrucomicrobium spinosum]
MRLSRRRFCFHLLLLFLPSLPVLPAEEPVKAELDIVSFNLRNGGRRFDGQYDHALQHRVIGALKPDLVALQEVDRRTSRVQGLDVPADFAKAQGMTFAYGAAMSFAGGEYGTAALSRLPIASSRTIALPVKGGEPRAATLITVAVPTVSPAEVTLVSVHFDSGADDAARRENARVLIAALKETTTPVILAGDFNDRPGSTTLTLLAEAGFRRCVPEGDASSYPADEPRLVIDHVLLRDGADVRLEDAGTKVVPNAEASDHRPLQSRVRVRMKTQE